MKSKSLVLSNTYVTKVQSLDALGQGICTIDGDKVFVPKTLPGENVECILEEKKKGNYFARLKSIQNPSPMRKTSECPHFSECNGCSYLHVDYEQELLFKKQALEKNLGYLKSQNYTLEVLSPNTRFHYRNRIQLHYHLGKNPVIGYLNKSQIIPMHQCLMPIPPLKQFLDSFLQNWQKLVPNDAPVQGHVELYFFEGKVQLNWNSPYAQLGFSQVNESANQLLIDQLRSFFINIPTSRSIIELFCGRGNLLSFLDNKHRITGFDIHGGLPSPHTFIQSNLYDPKELKDVLSLCKKMTFTDIVLDPPRSGLSNLADFFQVIDAQRLFYVSCWSSTMVRDLNDVYKIRPWSNATIFLIDMFPGTKHYETLFTTSW